MKKSLLTLIIFLSVIFNSSAQKSEIDTLLISNIFNNSNYIFEGTIINQCTYKDAKGIIYTNNLIDISRFVKGGLQCGTVNVITVGGEFNGSGLLPSHTTQFNKGCTGIFVCELLPTSLIPSCLPSTNNIYLTPKFAEQSSIEYFNDMVNSVGVGFGSQFASLTDLYDFIQNETGYSIAVCNNASIAPFQNISNIVAKYKTKPNSNVTNINLKNTGDNVTYTLSDPIKNGNYCEFDIMINSNDNLSYLDQAAIRIKYNSAAFGTSIASSVITTLGSNFSNTTYPTVQKIDKSSNVMSIWIHSAAIGQARTLITTTPQTLVHVKINFTNCFNYPNLKLDTFYNILDYSHFTFNPIDTTPYIYQYVTAVFTDSAEGESCAPIIYSIVSQKYGGNISAAGVGDIIEVQGKNFSDFYGEIYLKNADDGGNTELKLDYSDIVDWHDTIIKFQLFSAVDSNGNNIKRTGTGDIKIKNLLSTLTSKPTAQSLLTIKYNLTQIPVTLTSTGLIKPNGYLHSQFPNSRFNFVLNSNISDSDMIDCIRAAINHWRCITGVNFYLDETYKSSTGIVDDSLNVISIEPFTTQNYVAQTFDNYKLCGNTATNYHQYSASNIDIQISSNFLAYFNYDTTLQNILPANKMDFYAIITHELGHAIGHQHINDPTNLMFWDYSLISTNISANNRRRIDYNLQTGADTILKHSTANVNFNACAGNIFYDIPMILQDTLCRLIDGGNSITLNQKIDINIYPNPFNDRLTLKLTDIYNTNTSFVIYDIQGKQILNGQIPANTNNYVIQTNNLYSGIYLIQFTNINHSKTYKIICQK